MSLVAPPIVEVEFDLSTVTNSFVLNDPTQGLLDGTTYTLGGAEFTEITGYVFGVTISRTRSTATGYERYNAGTCSIVLNNDEAVFDPTIDTISSSYPYAGNIVPGKNVRVTIGTERQFVGIIQDWDYDYPHEGLATATIQASDRFVQLANQFITPRTVSGAVSSTMIETILDLPEINFPPADRDISTGQTVMQSVTYSQPTSALGQLQLIERSEPGALFITKDGELAFRSRRSNPTYSGAVEIRDDGTSITPKSIAVEYGSEQLFNRAQISRVGGSVQVAENTVSQESYGILQFTQDGLLMSTDLVAQSMAQYYANSYSQPLFRPRQVTVDMAAQSGSNQGLLQALDLDDLVLIAFTPPGGQLIEKYMIIVGITHQMSPARHDITYDLVDSSSLAGIYGDEALPPEDQPLSQLDSIVYGF